MSREIRNLGFLLFRCHQILAHKAQGLTTEQNGPYTMLAEELTCQIICALDVTCETIAVAGVYLARLLREGALLDSTNTPAVLLVCVVLACKYLEDVPRFTNSSIAEFVGMTLQGLNSLEHHVFFGIGCRLFVQAEEFEQAIHAVSDGSITALLLDQAHSLVLHTHSSSLPAHHVMTNNNAGNNFAGLQLVERVSSDETVSGACSAETINDKASRQQQCDNVAANQLPSPRFGLTADRNQHPPNHLANSRHPHRHSDAHFSHDSSVDDLEWMSLLDMSQVDLRC